MRDIIIYCAGVRSEHEFWDLYIQNIAPESAQYFGKNLDALWDALSAGGPGFPGEGISSVKLISTASLKSLRSGTFYSGLQSISQELAAEEVSKIKFTVE